MANTGLDSRSRDDNGRIRAKRSDTQAGTLAQTYPEFERMPPSRTLGEIQQQMGTGSLSETLRALRGSGK